jgi:hypothetical protein
VGEGPGTDGKATKYKSVTKMPDNDTMVMTMYMGDVKEPGFVVTLQAEEVSKSKRQSDSDGDPGTIARAPGWLSYQIGDVRSTALRPRPFRVELAELK